MYNTTGYTKSVVTIRFSSVLFGMLHKFLKSDSTNIFKIPRWVDRSGMTGCVSGTGTTGLMARMIAYGFGVGFGSDGAEREMLILPTE
jgi:hypothetical protein